MTHIYVQQGASRGREWNWGTEDIKEKRRNEKGRTLWGNKDRTYKQRDVANGAFFITG